MSYIENNLMPNEKLILKTNIHKIIFLKPLILLSIGLILIFNVIFSSNRVEAFLIVGVICFIIGILTLITAFITYKTSEFGFTDKRIIAKFGFIKRNSIEIFLDKLESIKVDQSVLGRILNYGTLVFIGTGGTREKFPLIPAPLNIRDQINNQIHK